MAGCEAWGFDGLEYSCPEGTFVNEFGRCEGATTTPEATTSSSSSPCATENCLLPYGADAGDVDLGSGQYNIRENSVQLPFTMNMQSSHAAYNTFGLYYGNNDINSGSTGIWTNSWSWSLSGTDDYGGSMYVRVKLSLIHI